MAESTLSVTYADLKEAVAHYQGYGRTSGNWNTRQTTNIEDSVKRGLREFYYAAVLPGEYAPHEWTFLKPRKELVIWPDASATMSVSTTTLTAPSAFFYPSMEKKTIVAASGTEYVIDSYTSSTVVELTADATGDNNTVFTITADGDYTFPNNVQMVEGPVTFTSSNAYWHPLEITSESRIRANRSNISQTGIPQMSAIDAMEYDSDNPTRYQLLIYPTPASTYTLKYKPVLAPDFFTADTDYPPGSALHTQTVIYMCEAASDKEIHGRPGAKENDAMRHLHRSVMADRVSTTPDSFGPMMDPANVDFEDVNDNDLRPGVYVNYNGTTYP